MWFSGTETSIMAPPGVSGVRCHLNTSEFNRIFGSNDDYKSISFPSFLPKKVNPLGYALEKPKGVFQPFMGASITYGFEWDDFAGDIEFPTGSSPQA